VEQVFRFRASGGTGVPPEKKQGRNTGWNKTECSVIRRCDQCNAAIGAGWKACVVCGNINVAHVEKRLQPESPEDNILDQKPIPHLNNPLVADFLTACCTLTPDARTRGAELLMALAIWRHVVGEPGRGLTWPKLAADLKEWGCTCDLAGGSAVWRGVALNPDSPHTTRTEWEEEYMLRADHRDDAHACPVCGPYTLITDALGVVCYRCSKRF
jgi:hypothetical protein